MSQGDGKSGWQVFENDGVFQQEVPNGHADNDVNQQQPRHRRGSNHTGKDFSRARGPSKSSLPDDDEVEECQIRTYGGPLSKQDLRTELRTICSLNTLRKRFPISLWLPRYTLADLSGDFVAGLTVGLTVVPQALAYAQIADLPLEYGLYSAFMGPFVYALLGTSKDVSVGPTALICLLTSAFLPHRTTESAAMYAIILAFFCGCFQLLMGVLHLGFLMNFVSTPVMSGFTTAASIMIILGQMKGLLGIHFGQSRDNIVRLVHGYVHHINETNGWDVLLGIVCIGSIICLKALSPVLKWDRFRNKQTSIGWKILREIIKLICYGRYALVVIIATVVAAIVTMKNSVPLTITHEVRGGLPVFAVPDFTPDNKTFVEVVDDYGAGLVLIPLIGLFESIVVAKAFSHKFGYTIDSTQELIALGVSNILGSFVSSFPVTGAFSRSALNADSGVRTPLGGIVTGSFVLIAMSALSPVLQYIPKAALSAVIITAIVVMIDFKIFRDLWRVNKIELIPLCSTLLMCLFLGVQYGLPLGIGMSLLMLVYPLARPLVTVEYRRTYRREKDLQGPLKSKPKFNVSVTPHSALYFPSAEFFKDIFAKDLLNPRAFRYGVSAAPDFLYQGIVDDMDMLEDNGVVGKDEKLPPVVFNGIHLLATDYSTMRTLRNIVASCRSARREIAFINTSNELMRLVLAQDEDVKVQMDTLTVPPDSANSDAGSVTVDGLQIIMENLPDREDVSISVATSQAPTYSSVEFPSMAPTPSDLHTKV